MRLLVGEYTIKVRSARVEYLFTIKRKFTFITGDSGTGKTRFVAMIEDSKTNSRIKVSSEVPIRIYRDKDLLFEDMRDKNKQVIYLLDEAICRILNNADFARIARDSEGYFVLVTRKPFENIPYSALEIYNFSERKLGKKLIYSQVRQYYWKNDISVNAEYVLVEDSVVGYEFYKRTCNGVVKSANGNENIEKLLLRLENSKYNHIFVVADGAAFGSQVKKYMDVLEKTSKDIRLFCPESFEYLVLASGIVRVDKDKLINTQDYADSVKFFSWERYYTYLLEQCTKPYGGYKKNAKKYPKFLDNDVAVKKMYDVIGEIKNVTFMDR